MLLSCNNYKIITSIYYLNAFFAIMIKNVAILQTKAIPTTHIMICHIDESVVPSAESIDQLPNFVQRLFRSSVVQPAETRSTPMALSANIQMRNTRKKITFLIAFLLLLPGLLFAGHHRVIRVVDGDTIVINYHRKSEKVRLLCVNTTESVHPDKKQNIPMGKTASDYTKERLAGKYVALEFEGKTRGQYGRLLAYVFVDGRNFNLELVRKGLSPYYTKHGLSKRYDKKFREVERYARDHRLNIWGDPELTQKYLRLKSKWGQHSSQISPAPVPVQTKEWKYVASKKSNVFHHPYCKWVKRIKPVNLIGFRNREEALVSGRRPCMNCKP